MIPLLARLGAACAAPVTTEETAVPTTSDGITLSWTFERGPDHLDVRYTVRNDRPETVWLLDRVLYWPPGTGVGEGADRVIVRSGAPGQPARLVRGYLEPQSLPQVELPPGARPLGPGQTAEGSARVALPLASWHPNENRPQPLSPPTELVLEIGVLPSAPAEKRRLADGAEVPVPSLAQVKGEQVWVRGAPLPL